MTCDHDFRKFDGTRVFCRKCGTFSVAPEPEWVDKLLDTIRAMPHVCYHPVPYVPQPYPWWITTSGTTQPNLGPITVWSGTANVGTSTDIVRS